MPIEDLLPDVVTETTHVGFGQKFAGSLFGALFGMLLLAGSGWGLFWNEGRSVTSARSLTEGAKQVTHIESDRVLPDHDGKLVHITGPLKTTAPLVDPEFGISTPGAVLVRHVEMFQWKEDKETTTTKNFGGSEERKTTYTYSKEWSSTRNDSSRFKQRERTNPQMRYRGTMVVAKDGTLGAFRPSDAVLRRLHAGDTLSPEPSLIEGLRKRLGQQVHIVDGQIYLGADPANPAIGDLRISYRLAKPDVISIVGRQTGPDFSQFQTKAGDALLFVKPGSIDAAAIFSQAQAENRMLTWIIRAVGLVVMGIAFMLVLSPLVALADIIPPLGSLLGFGTAILAFLATAIVGPLVIAIAWFWYRPIVSIIVLAVGLAVAVATGRFAPRRKAPAAAAPPKGALPA